MGDPASFAVEAEHNPHMRSEDGSLQIVQNEIACQQWQSLADAYESIGIQVATLPHRAGLVDLCFSANPALVLPMPNGKRIVWLSRMAHDSRQGEVSLHEEFFQAQGIPVRNFPSDVQLFEGTGDGILHPGRFILHAGVGPRSKANAWEHLATENPDLEVFLYELQDSRFYHLDTALVPLDESTAMAVPEAFDQKGKDLIHHLFPNAFSIPLEEALRFAGNAHCPDGKHVLLQEGNPVTEENLVERGFTPIPLQTSEFMKSGGSVFCLKLSW